MNTCHNCTYWVERRNINGDFIEGSEFSRWCTARPPIICGAVNRTAYRFDAAFPTTPHWMICSCWEARDLS